jgi:hypothetical protein
MKNIMLLLLMVTVHLAWDSNNDPSVLGYRLYYGKSSRNYHVIVDVGNVTDFWLTDVDETQPIFFAVTAYAEFIESDYSVELVVKSISTGRKVLVDNDDEFVPKIKNGRIIGIHKKILPTLWY